MKDQKKFIKKAFEIGGKGAPAVELERQAFEAWMRGHCWPLHAKWNGLGYISESQIEPMQGIDPLAMRTRMMWAAWRDRASLG